MQYKDFTNDPVNFPSTDMKQFIEDVHAHGQHYGKLPIFINPPLQPFNLINVQLEPL